MKAKQRILISSASVVFGLSLVVGSVFASNTVWAVTDQTTPLAAALTADSLVKVRFFNYDGSIISSEDVYSGSTVSSVPSPTLNGYTFDYWSTNNSTYEKTNENIATKQFTVNTDYYARFASYGYKIGDGSAAHLANKWDINNNTLIAHGSSLTLGTYIYGKTSLENATSAVTIPNAGGYALVCGAHESSWDSSKAGNLNNWSIQRYLTVTKTADWNDLKLFARVNKSEGYEDKFLSEVSGNDYFVYADYDAISINFGAVASNVDTVPDNLGATTKYLDAITLDDTTSYTLPGTVYYLTGHFGDVDWNTDSNYILTQDSTDTNLYVKSGVTLAENDLFKIKTNANVWYANESEWDGKNYSLDSGGNMEVTKAGVYNIKYHSDWNYNKIDFEAASLYSTFTVTYDSLASGYDIYLCGIDEDWSIVSANKLTPTGTANTYSITKLASDETVNYRYVISDGDSNHDWDTLNPDGNWSYTLGSDYTYTYVAPSPDTYTLTYTSVEYGTSNGQGMFVTGDFANWKCEVAYRLDWIDGNHLTGSFNLPVGAKYKLVIGPYEGNSQSPWRYQSGSDNVLNSDTVVNSSISWDNWV